MKNFYPTLSRRDFLTLAWRGLLAFGGLLTAGGLLRFLSYPSGPTRKTQFELGQAEDYAVGSVTPVADGQALLLCNPDGFAAMSALCPHLGCQLEPVGDGFVCPCHASRFDAGGQVQNGPATRSLKTLRVEETEQGTLNLYLD